MDCSPPDFSVHGISQARILEGVVISSSTGSSRPKDQTVISYIGREILYLWATREAQADLSHIHLWTLKFSVKCVLWCMTIISTWRRQWHPTPGLLPGKSHGWRSLVSAVQGVTKSETRLSDFTFTFHFHALEKEMATHSCVLAWRIPGTAEPGGLPSVGSHRVGHDWSDLAAVTAASYLPMVSAPYLPGILNARKCFLFMITQWGPGPAFTLFLLFNNGENRS